MGRLDKMIVTKIEMKWELKKFVYSMAIEHVRISNNAMQATKPKLLIIIIIILPQTRIVKD